MPVPRVSGQMHPAMRSVGSLWRAAGPTYRLVALCFNQQIESAQVVFLHGVLGSVHTWRLGQAPIVEQTYRWYSLSLPGHYPAAFPHGFDAARLTAETIAQVLAEAIREITDGQRAILVGLSARGFAALDIAVYVPEVAHGVFCVSGFAQGRWTGVLGALQRLARAGPAGRALFGVAVRTMCVSRAAFRAGIRLYAVDLGALYANPLLEPYLDLNYPDTRRLDVGAMPSGRGRSRGRRRA